MGGVQRCCCLRRRRLQFAVRRAALFCAPHQPTHPAPLDLPCAAPPALAQASTTRCGRASRRTRRTAAGGAALRVTWWRASTSTRCWTQARVSGGTSRLLAARRGAVSACQRQHGVRVHVHARFPAAWPTNRRASTRAPIPPLAPRPAPPRPVRAGNGGSVRAMRLRGKAAFGIELSQAVLERDAPDLLAAGYVEQGSLTNLPYQGACSGCGEGAENRRGCRGLLSRACWSCGAGQPRQPGVPGCVQWVGGVDGRGSARPKCWGRARCQRRRPGAPSYSGSAQPLLACLPATFPSRPSPSLLCRQAVRLGVLLRRAGAHPARGGWCTRQGAHLAAAAGPPPPPPPVPCSCWPRRLSTPTLLPRPLFTPPLRKLTRWCLSSCAWPSGTS